MKLWQLCVLSLTITHLPPHTFAQQVEEVKMVLRLLPVFFCCILYWTIYTQMSAMFVNQGNNMNRVVEWHGTSFKVRVVII